MGQGSSQQSSGQVLSKAGEQPAYKQNLEPPYPGPSPEYRFINTTVSNTARFSFGQGEEIMTSNIDAYYPLLSGQYNEGFRMISFYKTPQETRGGGLFSQTIDSPYQGIYCRYPYKNEGWRLLIEKSVIQPQVIYNGLARVEGSGTLADSSQLVQSIAKNCQNGGRLICVETTGQQLSQGFSGGLAGRLPTIGVDVFFDTPTHHNPEIYSNHIVSVPLQVKAGFASQSVHCDWAAHLGNFLSQGWRLVEIFMDTGVTAGKAFSMTTHMNSIWFFEKPLSRATDPTPVFQGTFIEHMVELKTGLTGTHAVCGWEGKIQEMANSGWELACILRTPEMRTSGFGSVELKFIIFFQRKLLYEQAVPLGYLQPASHAEPPPSYDTLK